MDNTKTQIAEQIKQATNILISVSSSPSVDQLSAAIGLTLILNHLGKHATAVFSGDLPPVMNFLHPEKTIEKDTDSLRDFIIALDKSKADKLRYKVEDDHVKIFITPYRSSITEADLVYSQGDFNVEVVVAIGVLAQTDLDTAITTHGRILHDATVVSINTRTGGEIGSINWVDSTASSLSEMAVQLATALTDEKMDEQMATALLTGIVAETDRFSNEKTTASTMTISAQLMAAGANQQLVATELQAPALEQEVFKVENEPSKMSELPQIVGEDDAPESIPQTPEIPPAPPVEDDGALHIEHTDLEQPAETPALDLPEPPEFNDPELPDIQIDEQGVMAPPEETTPIVEPEPASQPDSSNNRTSLILDPPTLGGTLTANSRPESYEMPVDPLSQLASQNSPLLSRDSQPASDKLPEFDITSLEKLEAADAAAEVSPAEHVEQTLAELEEDIKHETETELAPPPPVDHARDAVSDAIDAGDNNPFDPALIDDLAGGDVTDQITQAVESGDVPLPNVAPAEYPLRFDPYKAGLEPTFVPPAPALPVVSEAPLEFSLSDSPPPVTVIADGLNLPDDLMLPPAPLAPVNAPPIPVDDRNTPPSAPPPMMPPAY